MPGLFKYGGVLFLVHGVIPDQVQELALLIIRLHEILINPLLQGKKIIGRLWEIIVISISCHSWFICLLPSLASLLAKIFFPTWSDAFHLLLAVLNSQSHKVIKGESLLQHHLLIQVLTCRIHLVLLKPFILPARIEKKLTLA